MKVISTQQLCLETLIKFTYLQIQLVYNLGSLNRLSCDDGCSSQLRDSSFSFALVRYSPKWNRECPWIHGSQQWFRCARKSGSQKHWMLENTVLNQLHTWKLLQIFVPGPTNLCSHFSSMGSSSPYIVKILTSWEKLNFKIVDHGASHSVVCLDSVYFRLINQWMYPYESEDNDTTCKNGIKKSKDFPFNCFLWVSGFFFLSFFLSLWEAGNNLVMKHCSKQTVIKSD